ncbi:secreted RxLR effector protein 161-like [Solanum lycopersicum]|uniref:secreted RxLR effector protein 161-like n=1 Tax=Solanum lycopersicum TaxID=4081 RepID=UPI0008FECCE9
MAESKTAPTPMDVHPPSTSDSRLFDNPTLYRSIVGGLHYLAVTRPDIQYAVNRVSQSMHAPTEQNFQALKRILRYLKGSLRRGLLFTKGNLELSVYSDSDWANDKDDRRSTTGYLLFLGPNLISWCTKKQTRVSLSSTEAEYRAIAVGVAEAMWLHHITDALGLPPFRPKIYCDNESTICVTKNPVLHDRMKHVGSDCHFVREQVMAGTMSTHHVPSSEQLADLLTKPLPPAGFHYLATKHPLVSVDQLEGG